MPELSEIARLPHPSDNCAIAISDLPAGLFIQHGGQSFALSHQVLEGHRFAARPIPAGAELSSWQQRFGIARRAIAAGDYVINAGVSEELARRDLQFPLPERPNFDNRILPYHFDAANVQPSPPLPRYPEMRYFEGYARGAGRGVGTRNMIVLLGTSSLVAGFTRALAQLTAPLAADFPNVDGIVPVAHTEGGHQDPNNRELILRTLAGFMTHPNVGAVVALDYGGEAINNADLSAYLQQNNYPIADVPHRFHTLSRSFDDNVAWFKALLAAWLPQVNRCQRRRQPLSALKIALQCGGSDAFSGISGNPLAAWVAKEVIRYGGSANLAETDELIGAEAYLLEKLERVELASRFLALVARFKERVGWHGQTAEGNPSGGNKFRGLYNIYLKSLGAAAKRHPEVPLHDVIEYSQPMTSAGFYFMDSPGNDLESIAGQVASGCNMIFFVTGNGSITNFPFVPTIKIVTTTARYQLLRRDMDVNAGAYLDGQPMAEVGARTLDLTVAVAAGQRSVGERAGHYQVQIWRDWQQTRPANVTLIQKRHYSGAPINIAADVTVPPLRLPAYAGIQGATSEQIGLLLPTSLCSGQIAQMTVAALTEAGLAQAGGITRFATLVHTEGCGGTVVPEYKETLLSYLQHPKVRHALLLEHGCEITHNSYFRAMMAERGLEPAEYGWASIQLDGGIDAVMRKIRAWFQARLLAASPPQRQEAGMSALRLGMLSQTAAPAWAAAGLAALCKTIVAGGGSVVISENDALLSAEFRAELGLQGPPAASLAYGQRARQPGFYIMANPRRHWGEALAGLGAAGLEVFLGYVDGAALASHPLIPVLQVSAAKKPAADVDASLRPGADLAAELLPLIAATFAGDYQPRQQAAGIHDFQVTRGMLGVSF